MKKGFTLLELMIVIIIIGVLATLGIMQYQATIEKSRGAEARSVISTLRNSCAAIWMREGTTTLCDNQAGTNEEMGLDNGAVVVTGRIPGGTANCWGTNYFSYQVTSDNANGADFLATRCLANGKTPNSTAAVAGTVTLQTDYATGQDIWVGVGGF
jgi:prepilin-type N-terminal cleavage/methylation domain-containing protein